MTDREKVIKGLECCIKRNPDDKTRCGECPYEGACLNRLKSDALAMLKAQEPTSTPQAEWLLYKGRQGATCSFCKHTYHDVYDVESYDYYCRHCGAKMVRIRTVKWE
jgi:Zn finger protein HypA/HybF involved in hydrogenase expression